MEWELISSNFRKRRQIYYFTFNLQIFKDFLYCLFPHAKLPGQKAPRTSARNAPIKYSMNMNLIGQAKGKTTLSQHCPVRFLRKHNFFSVL